jgi:thioredoxin 1
MKKTIYIVLALVITSGLILVGYSFSSNETEKASEVSQSSEIAENSQYQLYSEDKISNATPDDKIVIFFHATWCPTCRLLNRDIERNLSTIPDSVLILKADYDKETKLKQKYGVTLQHTLVQVDNEGNMLAKWHQTPTLDKVLKNLE